MNIYRRKLWWKFSLLLLAIVIGLASLWYTNNFVELLSHEERKKVELWAEATQRIVDANLENEDFSFLLKVIQYNTTVPVIVADTNDVIMASKNLDSLKMTVDQKYVEKQLAAMKAEYEPILIELPDGDKQFIYYNHSTVLNKLAVYPYIQLSVIIFFILMAYWAFSSARKAEQKKVWVGLSKETAHQLGTPLSSLMAWYEVLKTTEIDPLMVEEFGKDITRLEKVTERFSKIGSKPKLHDEDIILLISNVVNYVKRRASGKVEVIFEPSCDSLILPVNSILFEWVIENICKNSMDAIEGEGRINIHLTINHKHIYIDIADTGKGIAKSLHKAIFKPGFTTKSRGWGLGLSLTKRIVEEYHNGKIFVLNSELNKGTIMRIVLKKNL